MIDLDIEVWRQRVFALIRAEYGVAELFQAGKITKEEKEEAGKYLNSLWSENWKKYPDKNPLVAAAFEANFGAGIQ